MKMVWISGSFWIGNSDGIGDVGGIGNIGGAIGIDSDGIGGFDGMNGIGNNIGVSGIGWWLGWEKRYQWSFKRYQNYMIDLLHFSKIQLCM